MADVAILEQAVLQNLREVLGFEASIERKLARLRKTGKSSASLERAVSNLYMRTAYVEHLLGLLERRA
jgi:hypothetical protein